MFNGAEASAALDQYRLLQIALKFGDEDLQFFFREVKQIAGQIGAPALEFSEAPRL
jgi:hypothetical protein